MTNTHSAFLKEMGITQWTSRETAKDIDSGVSIANSITAAEAHQASKKSIRGIWWFYGNEPQGDAKILFQNMIRALGLVKNEWMWKGASKSLSQMGIPELPVVAVAFGGSVAQKITGEKDPLTELRQTVLALIAGGNEEVPVIASFDLPQVLTKPKEKAMLWQDLLLARSVLQNS